MLACLATVGVGAAGAGELRVQLTGWKADQVTTVGVLQRWDADGNPTRPVNPKARIETPEWTTTAKPVAQGSSTGTTWVFPKLNPGRYDVVILTKDRRRIDGFTFAPVLEFDPPIPSERQPSPEAREIVAKQIAKSKQYENRVTPLYFAGDDKTIRVFMQLLRDEATSFDAEFGQAVATLRHEVWQYTNQYGGWVKEKRTRVFDRVLTGKADLQRWTWLWDPRLGGIEIDSGTRVVEYELPEKLTGDMPRGLLPAAP